MLNFKEYLLQEMANGIDSILSRIIILNVKDNEKEILSMPSHANYQFVYAKNKQIDRTIDKNNKILGLLIGGWGQLKVSDEYKDKIPNLSINVTIGEPRHVGMMDKNNDILYMNIGIPLNDKGNLDYHAANPMIKAILRHELEHSQQKDTPFFTKKQKFDWDPVSQKAPMGANFGNIEQMKSYLFHPSEIEAWVSGVYKYAKSAKISFTQAAQIQLDRLYKSMVESGTNAEDAIQFLDELKEKWLQYQKYRYPKAQL